MGEKMVDRVMRLMSNPQHIRNICTSAHIDHGKTTFTDNLLAGAGMISEDLAGKQLVMDFHEDEIERGITIDSANVSMVHEVDGQEYLINLIDTPGHVDFGGDVTRAMRAVDGTIVLVDCVEGMMPQTETVLKQALRERVKPVLFINKVDRLIKELQLTPEQMQERFIAIIASVNRFIDSISPEEFKGKWNVNVQEGSVAFGSAFNNWALSVPYMQKTGITFKDVIDSYQSGGSYKEIAKKAPLHKVVLNMVIKHHPDPKQAQIYRIPKIWHGDLESVEGKALMTCDSSGPLAFVITKVVVDPQAGEISAGRLFSGTVTKGAEVYLNRAKQHLRVQQIFIYNGPKKEIVDNVACGNIIGVAGIRAFPGETISSAPIEPFEQLTHIFEPVITKAIEAKNPADLPKLIEVMRKIVKEDPSIKVQIDEETGEHLMSGMGELHLEVIENRIRTEKGVEVKTSAPIVVYRETITKASQQEAEGKSPNKHNKFYFKVEPLSDAMRTAIKAGDIPEMRIKKKDLKLRDKFVECGMETKQADSVKDVFKGNLMTESTRGQVHLGEVMEMIQDMFEDVMGSGPLAREPCIGVKVTLTDLKLHEDAIHRGPAQVYPAVREGIRAAMMMARPSMYEPIQTMRFEAPLEFMGEISKLIANKRGQLLDMQQEGEHITVIGKLPVGEMFGLSSTLRSATAGRGSFFVVDQSYDKLPEELQGKIIGQIRQRKGLKEEEAVEE
jgi:elongation factor 2